MDKWEGVGELGWAVLGFAGMAKVVGVGGGKAVNPMAEKMLIEDLPNTCGIDCIGGKTPVSVLYPDGSIEVMSIKKFYVKFQKNTDLKLVDSNGNKIPIESITQKFYEGEMISFNVETNDKLINTRLTPEHLVQLMDEGFVPAENLINGMEIKTRTGPKQVSDLNKYKVTSPEEGKSPKVYEIITKEKDKSYILDEEGPSLKTPFTDGGIADTIITKNYAQKILDSGRVVTSSRELRSIALKSGCIVKPGGRHLDVRREDGVKLTEIPNGDVNPNTSKGILKSIASGEPSLIKPRD